MALNGFSGASGIAYGLNLRGVPKKGPARPLAALAAPASSSDDDDTPAGDVAAANATLQAVQRRLRESAQAQETYAAALAEDATVFDYDGVYDEMKASKAKSAGPRAGAAAGAAAGAGGEEAATRGGARYIGQLLVKAKERERESEVVFERRTVKEREKEDHLYGDKDKFVTAAYKAKLAADAAWLAEEKVREEAEAKDDVTRRRDLSGFYANLLTKNEAFGGAAPAPARPPPSAPPPPSPAPAPAPVAAPAPPPPPQQPAEAPPAPPPPSDRTLERVDVGPAAGFGAEAAAALASSAAAAAAAASAVLLPAKRERAGEDALASARERFLARKRAAGAPGEAS